MFVFIVFSFNVIYRCFSKLFLIQLLEMNKLESVNFTDGRTFFIFYTSFMCNARSSHIVSFV